MFKRNPDGAASPGRIRKLLRRRRVQAGIIILAIVGALLYFREGATDQSSASTFTVRKGTLPITVVEGGSIEALQSQDIRSTIKGETKILSIVDEGYLVSEDDVKHQKVLVTLDDSELLERKTQIDIEYQTALADMSESREQYEIQVKQNESDINAAELEAKFALMDFQKYMGDELAGGIFEEVGLRTDLAQMRFELEENAKQNSVAHASTGPTEDTEGMEGGDLPADAEQITLDGAAANPEDATAASSVETNAIHIEMSSITTTAPRPTLDFTKYANEALLGDGAAQQELRKLQSDRFLAEEELSLAETKLSGTRRLAEKNFVTQQDLDSDEMSVKKSEIGRDAAVTAEELFIKYEFPKEAEKLLSAYEEGLNKLERTIKQAIAKEVQAGAKKLSSEANFSLRAIRQRELQEQLDACTLTAERPGLVVYAGSDEPWRNREQIEEGATVYERQEIITIPDMTQMAVKVKVHESSIKKIERGQRVRIILDAYPDRVLEGEVAKISVLPDSSSRWMNPDIKIYPVTASIDGSFEWLKPSMSAQVEIFVKELKDVLFVPVQAVVPDRGQRVCYVLTALGGEERRVVQVGEFNNEFIEIVSGLEEGEHVLLRAPQSSIHIAGEQNAEKGSEGRSEAGQSGGDPQGGGGRQRGERQQGGATAPAA